MPGPLPGGDVGIGTCHPSRPGRHPWRAGPWRLCGLAPASAGSAAQRSVDGVERDREGEQVTVVDAAVLELPGEGSEQAGPVLALGRDRRGDLHAPLDDPDRG